MSAQKVVKVRAVLKTAKGIHNVIAQVKGIVAGMAANPGYFPSPDPPLATVNADLAALEASETVALTRATGAVEAHDVRYGVVLDHLHHLLANVQRAADGDPKNAEAIVTCTTMSVRKVPTHIKQEFVAQEGAVSGTVKLVAKSAAPRASYEWQWSLDQKSWTNVPSTLKAKVIVTGLAPAVMHYFRYRAVTKAGTSDWSQVASIIVK